MLTKADDYPIHQTPDPVAFAGTDRNFYDRYFFNGYTRTGDVFFSAALGVYPQLNITDASFCLVHKGVQHNVHASRHLGMERLDTEVGPIKVTVLEPLRSLRVTVDSNDQGITADLTFHARAVPVQEPRFTRRNGPRVFMDVTRMTQNGTWEGWIEIAGERIDVSRDQYVGTRDRSWGVRPVGAPDAQPLAPAMPPQFYWLWAPLNFDDRITLFHQNDDAAGDSWNISGVMCGLDGAEPEKMEKSRAEITYLPGSRYAKSATIFFDHKSGGQTRIDLTPKWNFYMLGLGYGHPDWTHGGHKGPLVVGGESFKLSDITSYHPPHLHIQAFVTATLTSPDGTTRDGCGVLEQLIIGPHAPSGFKDVLDPYEG
ncbi:hypothetical protein CLV47_101423 [Antricoccus suffuscus]|uniref:Hydroxyneurosporene synthase CrtC n=1 Tax=Antricoccus suffuscus TaxID=1629062 RepID=A0A2T1A746_9ACTN|nr:hypothetical protein [Antricoccus suffuscus]PRZ44297.1 hypothetical protein CLV47_101423 [Antricoccus suffuscus]